MAVNSIGTMPYGSACWLYSSKGGVWGAELAASMVGNPKTRVGLAAKYWGMGVGLAASFGQLTGYIWIWQNHCMWHMGATVVCAWA